VLTLWGQEIQCFGTRQACRIQKAAQGASVVQFNDNFFVSRG